MAPVGLRSGEEPLCPLPSSLDSSGPHESLLFLDSWTQTSWDKEGAGTPSYPLLPAPQAAQARKSEGEEGRGAEGSTELHSWNRTQALWPELGPLVQPLLVERMTLRLREARALPKATQQKWVFEPLAGACLSAPGSDVL